MELKAWLGKKQLCSRRARVLRIKSMEEIITTKNYRSDFVRFKKLKIFASKTS